MDSSLDSLNSWLPLVYIMKIFMVVTSEGVMADGEKMKKRKRKIEKI